MSATENGDDFLKSLGHNQNRRERSGTCWQAQVWSIVTNVSSLEWTAVIFTINPAGNRPEIWNWCALSLRSILFASWSGFPEMTVWITYKIWQLFFQASHFFRNLLVSFPFSKWGRDPKLECSLFVNLYACYILIYRFEQLGSWVVY